MRTQPRIAIRRLATARAISVTGSEATFIALPAPSDDRIRALRRGDHRCARCAGRTCLLRRCCAIAVLLRLQRVRAESGRTLGGRPPTPRARWRAWPSYVTRSRTPRIAATASKRRPIPDDRGRSRGGTPARCPRRAMAPAARPAASATPRCAVVRGPPPRPRGAVSRAGHKACSNTLLTMGRASNRSSAMARAARR